MPALVESQPHDPVMSPPPPSQPYSVIPKPHNLPQSTSKFQYNPKKSCLGPWYATFASGTRQSTLVSNINAMCIIISFCLLALWSRHGTKTVVFVLSKRFGNTIGWSHIFFVRSKRQQSPLIVTRTKRPHYGLLNTSPTSVTMKKYRENGKSSMKSWYNASQKLILHFSFVCFNLE